MFGDNVILEWKQKGTGNNARVNRTVNQKQQQNGPLEVAVMAGEAGRHEGQGSSSVMVVNLIAKV